MKFRNTRDAELSFTIGGVHYQVPPSGTCVIPDRVAYAVRGYGLPLVEVSADDEASEAIAAAMVATTERRRKRSG